MVDYRYHLASLMALFLALGIGILVGNAFVGQTSANWQQETLEKLSRDVAEVQRQSRRIQQEDQELRQRMQLREKAERAVATALVRGTLAGKRVALVTCGDMAGSEALGQLTSVLGAAGAEVLSTASVADQWLAGDDDLRRYAMRRFLVSEEAATEQQGAVTRALARALVSGIWSGALQDVSKRVPRLSLQGDFTRPVDCVVLISSARNRKRLQQAASGETPEAALLGAWRELGIRVVAAEPLDAELSLVPVFQRHSVPTVDNVDTPAGQAAVALALAAASFDGDFGMKSTAQKVLPDLPDALPLRAATEGAEPAAGDPPRG